MFFPILEKTEISFKNSIYTLGTLMSNSTTALGRIETLAL